MELIDGFMAFLTSDDGEKVIFEKIIVGIMGFIFACIVYMSRNYLLKLLKWCVKFLTNFPVKLKAFNKKRKFKKKYNKMVEDGLIDEAASQSHRLLTKVEEAGLLDNLETSVKRQEPNIKPLDPSEYTKK